MAKGFQDKRRTFNTGSMGKGVQIKLDGDWQAASWMMKNLSTDIQLAYIKAQVTIAKRLQKIIKNHIKDSDLSWAPLATRTIERKGHDRPWYDTGAIYNNITVITKGLNVFVGVKEGVMDYDGNRSLAAIAAANEYGTRKAPARPLFLPSSKEIDKNYVRRVFGMHLTKRMLSTYGVKPTYR